MFTTWVAVLQTVAVSRLATLRLQIKSRCVDLNHVCRITSAVVYQLTYTDI
jgi:hypothetical protein